MQLPHGTHVAVADGQFVRVDEAGHSEACGHLLLLVVPLARLCLLVEEARVAVGALLRELLELDEEVAQMLLERRQVGAEVEQADDECEHLRLRQVGMPLDILSQLGILKVVTGLGAGWQDVRRHGME